MRPAIDQLLPLLEALVAAHEGLGEDDDDVHQLVSAREQLGVVLVLAHDDLAEPDDMLAHLEEVVAQLVVLLHLARKGYGHYLGLFVLEQG